MNARSGLGWSSLVACNIVMASGCGEPATPPPEEPVVTATATATQEPVPTTAPSATVVAPPRAPAAQGRDRLSFAVGYKERRVGVTLDVPSGWSVEPNENMGPSFQSCSANIAIVAPSVWVGYDECNDGEAAAACLDRVIAKRKDDDGTMKDGDKPASRRSVEFESTNKNGVKRTEVRVFVHDPGKNTVVHCGAMFADDQSRDKALYQDICSTLTVEDAALSAPALAARKPKPEGAPGNAADVPHGAELVKVAAAFHAAMLKGDAKAAKKLIVAPSDCDGAVPKEKVAKCKKDLAGSSNAIDKHMAELTTAAKTVEDPAGFYLMALSKPGDGLPLYLAYPLTKEAPCENHVSVGYIVAWVKDRAVILVEAGKKVEAKPTPKKK